MSQEQKPTTTGAPGDRATEFVPDQGGNDSTSASGLLVTAYVVMWAILLGVILLTWRRQQRIDARLKELERALEAAEKAAPGG
jgi:hypothetical protein